MEPWLLGVVLKPFIFFAFAFAVLYPARLAAQRFIPAGRIKKLLLSTGEEKKWLFIGIVVLFYVCLFTANYLISQH